MGNTREKYIYTVNELTRNIRVVLENTFGTVWVEGEISNFTKHQSGHMYFSIRDKYSVLACVLFRRVNADLKFEIKDGMQVLCFGKVSVYDKRGQYQLYVEKIEPKGAGALQVAFEQLKEKLRQEGLFDEGHKKPVPYLPRRVGVVTSPTGAAIRDILNVAKRRFSNIEIIVNPVTVQGDTAKHEIAEAIGLFNRLRNVDVIILSRGGGSLEDLWPFNEEVVARSIYSSEIPVISAVGHEVDWTISDFVADFRAPTPSAAAELVIPKKEDLIALLNGFSERMKTALISKIDFIYEKLKTLGNRYVFREPLNIITQYEQEIDSLAEGLILKGGFIVRFKNESLNKLAGKLEALSPLGILNRGYSITMREKDNQIIKDASTLREKELMRTRLGKGEFVSRVEGISTGCDSL
ncbi:MAG: exodeoxyribonuclease VII large subunit [Omnitrophica bacterium RBG_13_46_9]|nr:MAG: exodeoxyribonuclease VII large subunit [Omnitrophica bacterium RBG_13_46_9]